MSALEAAYDAVRAHLHGTGAGDAEALRSLLWITAEAVERHGRSGMVLRDLGDELTGATMSAGLRTLLQRQ